LGTAAGGAIADMLQRASDVGTGIMGVTIGTATLVLAATGAFVELQDDLDRIWKAEPRVGSGIFNLLKSRLLSFAMVLFIGFLLTVSLAVSAGVSAIGNYMFAEWELVLQLLNFAVSLAVITALFAAIYKILPNIDIAWRDVWVGAAVTALLFSIGKLLIGLYVGRSSASASFGAAGPFVVLLIWVYYSTQIFLLGAEFAARHAEHRRGAKTPADSKPSTQPPPQSAEVEPAAAVSAGSRAAAAFLHRRRAQALGSGKGTRQSATQRHRLAR
jgi:membrane protein